jgi:hypothetical protein
MNLVEIVETSLEKAYNNESNIDVYNIVMEGMSGLKTRHFYNNLGSHEGARYLEIGTWVGSSICSFMKGNKSKCVCIDNWSEFGGPKDIFMTHFNEHKGDNDATFIESNCWDVDPKTLGKFNIYMYDGAHDKESHHRALSHFMEALDEEFIYIVDDWNVEHIRQGTEDALISNNLEVIYKKEIFTDRNPGIQKGKLLNDWHNGIVVYVLRKTE